MDNSSDGILSLCVMDGLENHYFLSGFITILIVFVQALLLNKLTIQYRLFDEVTLYPGLFYILLVSSIQDFLPLSSVLLGNTFLILALINLLGTHKVKKCADTIFNVGFWIGLAALFYNSFVLFLLLGIIGILSLRTFKWQEVIIVLCGYFLPFLFVSTYFFWIDQLGEYWNGYYLNQFSFLDFQFKSSWKTYYKLIILALFFLMGLFNHYSFNKSYKVRNYLNIIYAALLISGFTFFVQQDIGITHFLVIAIPLSILIAARFLSMSKIMAEFTHLFLLFGILLFQFDIITF